MKPDFTKYDVEDFVSDESFVSWVNNRDSEFWARFVQDHPEKREQIALAEKLVGALTQKEEALSQRAKAGTWNKIEKSISGTSIVRRLFIAASVAAACLAVFYVTGLGTQSQNVILANNGKEAKEEVLPDQSIVVLTPGATLEYDAETYMSDRKVALKGRAFFEVQKGSPFAVTTHQGTVEVLGTSFDVDAMSGNFQVVCYTGKVRVSHMDTKVLLTPGEQTAFGKNEQNKEPFDLPANLQPDWISSYLAFENESLENVIREIENAYNVQVEVEPSLLNGVKHSGHVVKDDIEKALTSITWPHHLTFELEGDVVKIVNKVD